jgi:hypothetical protein
MSNNFNVKYIMKFKILTIIILLVINLAACQNENAKTESYGEIPVTTYYTVPFSSSGWSGEELINTFYLHGRQFSNDFTIGSLGKNYGIDRTHSELLEDGECGIGLTYGKKNLDFLTLSYDNVTSIDEVYDKNPYAISVNVSNTYEKYNKETIVLNGIKLGATREEIQAVFGQQTKGDADTMYYADRNKPDKSCLIFLLDDGKLFAFSLLISG